VSESDVVLNIQAGLRTRDEIRQNFNTWGARAERAGNFRDVITRQDGEEIMRVALTEYAREKNWPITGDVQRDIDNLARGWAEEQLAHQGIPVSIRFNDLQGACVDIAAAGVAKATGVNPALVRTSIQSFSDGRMSEEEMRDTCALAGSLAGATVGQAFGIPAPIGAWVGGVIGDTIGGLVSDVFGLGSDAEERRQKQIKREENNMDNLRWQASMFCDAGRVNYWNSFDQTLALVESDWERLECEVGARFWLRWFSPARGISMSDLNATHGVSCKIGSGTGTCCPHTYGCLYPNIYAGSSGRLDRAVRVFWARGLKWPACSTRKPCELLYWRHIDGESGAVERSRKSQYLAYLDRNARGYEQPDYWGSEYNEWAARYLVGGSHPPHPVKTLNRVSTMVRSDLMQTACAVQTEMAVYNQRALLAGSGLAGATIQSGHGGTASVLDLRRAIFANRNRAKLINYGTLAVGVGALGYALYRRNR